MSRTNPVRLKLIRPSAARARPIRRFEFCEWSLKFPRNDDLLHYSLLKPKPEEYHNVYEADENGIMFRADAIFEHFVGGNREHRIEVPIFASKDERGNWKWLLRFRPYYIGQWKVSLFIVHRHSNRHPRGEPSHVTEGSTGRYRYYQHVYGPARVSDSDFSVIDREPYIKGPLETPKTNDNPNYFYQAQGSTRKPFFLLGFARAWNSANPKPPWYPPIERKADLYLPMQQAHCNVLYHWFAPGETLLIHQAKQEWWYMSARFVFKAKPPATWPGTQLRGANRKLGYKRIDQGRAKLTDELLDDAVIMDGSRRSDNYLQFVIALMPHSLFQASGHRWHETRWATPPGDPPSYNGFSLFKVPGRSGPLQVKQFLEMTPARRTVPWRRQLWKHFANYLRYIFARWSAHPAVGAWILMDELEGIGSSTTWWWDTANASLTKTWHDNVVKLVRGGVEWGTIAGRRLMYTGDFLHHPISSSTTHYEGTNPGLYLDPRYSIFRPATRAAKRQLVDRFRRSGNDRDALALLEVWDELPKHGTWKGDNAQLDFVSHHAYQAVPCKGLWVTRGGRRDYVSQSNYLANRASWTIPGVDSNTIRYSGVLSRSRVADLKLPNQVSSFRIDADRWLWDSLCMRIRKWGEANIGSTRLITEFGCYERQKADQNGHHYGKRMPQMCHFAYWSALVSGHAGLPFKWNDAERHGEMQTRSLRLSPGVPPPPPARNPWSSANYPINNYPQIVAVDSFLKSLDRMGVSLHELQLRESYGMTQPYVVDDRGQVEWLVRPGDVRTRPVNPVIQGLEIPRFNVWALSDAALSKIVIWLYDRTFRVNGASVRLQLKLLIDAGNYEVWWYDTWNGVFDPGNATVLSTSSSGELKIPLKDKFFRSNDRNVTGVADGNDVAILVKRAQPTKR